VQSRPGEFIYGEYPGFVMEYVHGISGERMMFMSDKHYSLRSRTQRLLDIEVQKCLDLGFTCIDERFGNSIYLPKEDKVVILDFRHWKMPN